jgi:hypothetical protein
MQFHSAREQFDKYRVMSKLVVQRARSVTPYQFPLNMAYELLLSKGAVSVIIRGVEHMRIGAVRSALGLAGNVLKC